MRRIPLFLVVSFVLWPLGAGQGLAETASSRQEVYRLPNGLTVVLQEDHSAPVAAFQMWVRVGSADEPPAQAGIAHVFEHMLFKGTKKRPVGQIGREISAAGGDINAYTSNDQTVYHLVLASRYFDTGLDVLADAVQNSSFDPAELQKELEVVVEEIRRGLDNPDRVLWEMMDAVAYRLHPYGRPVIGTPETVRSLTREQILDFFHAWYVPNNMTLVVVGDFAIPVAKRKIAQAFRNFKPNAALRHVRPVEPPQAALRVTQEASRFKQDRLGLAFHIPPADHPDVPALDVMSDILSGGNNGLLINELLHKRQLVSSISAYSFTPVDPGTFVVFARFDPKQREETLRQSLRILFGLANGEFPARRLTLAKRKTAADFVFKKETAQGMAGELGYYQAMLRDVHFGEKYLQAINELTSARLAEVAAKYFRPENLSLALLAEEGAPLTAESTLRRIVEEEWLAASARPRALAIRARQVVQGTYTFTFENGARLLVTPDVSLPIVAYAGGFQGGLRDEPAALAGVANFMSALMDKGTANLTREQISDRLESVRGSLGFAVNSDALTFYLTQARYAGEEEPAGLPLLAEVIRWSTFPPDEVEKVRKLLLAQFAQREDDLFRIGLLHFLPGMFGDNGYGRMALGERAVVEKLTREQIADYARTALRPDTLVLSVVGDIEPEEFAAEFARQFAGWRVSQGVPAYTATPLAWPPLAAPVTMVVPKNKAQSHIFYGWRTVGLRDKDRYPLEVLNAIMAGMGGRLFLELRDRQSLAYSVTSLLPMRYDAGAFLVYLGCAPDKVPQAMQGIREQIARVRDRGVLAKEVDEAKRFLIGNLAVDLQTRSARASSILAGDMSGLGLRFDFDRYPREIERVSVDDVNRVARQYLNPAAYVFVLVQ